MPVPTFDVDVLPDHVIETFVEEGLAQEEIENLNPTLVFCKWLTIRREQETRIIKQFPHAETIYEVAMACEKGRMFQ
jgi:hypothetical protein